MDAHVHQIVLKATQKLYFMSQLKKAGLSRNDLLCFYKSVVCLNLEYAVPVFATTLPKYLRDNIECIQKRVMRIFPNLCYTEALEWLYLETLDERRMILRICKMKQTFYTIYFQKNAQKDTILETQTSIRYRDVPQIDIRTLLFPVHCITFNKYQYSILLASKSLSSQHFQYYYYNVYIIACYYMMMFLIVFILMFVVIQLWMSTSCKWIKFYLISYTSWCIFEIMSLEKLYCRKYLNHLICINNRILKFLMCYHHSKSIICLWYTCTSMFHNSHFSIYEEAKCFTSSALLLLFLITLLMV